MADPGPQAPQAPAWPRSGNDYMRRFHHAGGRPAESASDGPLADIFWSHEGPVAHKWHHYLPLYDRYFAPWRGCPLRFLEIGVSRGGSLGLWRKYFGAQATIFGIDIDPGCAALDGRDGAVRIGSQDDPVFLDAVVAEMGGLDIVLDDGSHRGAHIRASLDALFPRLSTGGLYFIEDLQTAYWTHFSGRNPRRQGFMRTVAEMIDDLHGWYHPFAANRPATAGGVVGIHVHDSIVVLEKGTRSEPRHSRVGTDPARGAPA